MNGNLSPVRPYRQCISVTLNMHETHLSKIDLNLLVVLQELLTARSVTGAAKRLGLSQPAVSRALGRLRALLNDPLFVRAPAGLITTPRAEALRVELDQVLGRIESMMVGRGRFDPTTSTRAFTVIAADYAQAVILPPLLQRLSSDAPQITLRVLPQSATWEQQLNAGEAHFFWAPQRKAAQTIVWSELFDEGFGFVVRRGHPASKRPLTLERFLALRHLALSPEGRTGNPLDQHLANLGVRREIVAQLPSFLVIAPLIASTDLAVTLPRRIIEQQGPRWGLVELKLPFTAYRFTTSNGWHERFRHDSGHAWFRQCILETGKSLR